MSIEFSVRDLCFRPVAAVWTISWEKEAWPVFALLSPEVGTSRLLNLQLFPTVLR